jgi:hypothetical protein
MKTEQIRVATEVKSNIEIGNILVREIDITYKYRVVYINVWLAPPPPDDAKILMLLLTSVVVLIISVVILLPLV